MPIVIPTPPVETPAAPPPRPPRPTFRGLPLPLTGRENPAEVARVFMEEINNGQRTPVMDAPRAASRQVRHIETGMALAISGGRDQIGVYQLVLPAHHLRTPAGAPSRGVSVTLYANGEMANVPRLIRALRLHAEATRVERERQRAVERLTEELNGKLSAALDLAVQAAGLPAPRTSDANVRVWTHGRTRITVEVERPPLRHDTVISPEMLTGCAVYMRVGSDPYESGLWSTVMGRLPDVLKAAYAFAEAMRVARNA